MASDPGGGQTARLKRWLLWGGAGVALLGGLWVVIHFTGPAPRGSRGEQTVGEILLTGDSRQTSLEGLAAQLDSARRENAGLRADMARLEDQMGRTIDSVRMALERELQSDRSRSEAERARETQRLQRELKGLQGGASGTTVIEIDEDMPAAVPPSPLAGASDPAATPPPERRDDDQLPPERREDAGSSPPRRSENVSPTPRRDGTGVTPVRATGTEPEQLPAFPDALQPVLPEDALFRDRQAPAGNPAEPAAGSRRGTAAGAALQPPKPVIRIVGSDVPENQPLPPAADATYRLPATSILTGTLITGLDASTASQSKRDPFPVLVRLQKTAILPNRYQADVRECFVLLAGYGDLSSERAYMRGETVSCVLKDGKVIETKLQGYAAGEDGKAGVRGRLVTKQGQFIARALMVGFLQGAAEVLNKGDTVTLGLSQTNNQEDGSPWGSAALKGTGNALDRIAEFYIDQAYNLFPVIEIDAGRQLDIVLTGHVDMPLPNS